MKPCIGNDFLVFFSVDRLTCLTLSYQLGGTTELLIRLRTRPVLNKHAMKRCASELNGLDMRTLWARVERKWSHSPVIGSVDPHRVVYLLLSVSLIAGTFFLIQRYFMIPSNLGMPCSQLLWFYGWWKLSGCYRRRRSNWPYSYLCPFIAWRAWWGKCYRPSIRCAYFTGWIYVRGDGGSPVFQTRVVSSMTVFLRCF